MNYYSNINKINEDIESFVIAKQKIETQLIEDKKIEKKMSIKDFLNYMKFNLTYVYFENSKMFVIGFTIFNTKNDVVVLYASSNEFGESDFKSTLEYIKFDTKQLKHYTQIDIISGKLANKPYFIINNEFYALN